jgi:taurine---2-oxoglutarate transaminase
MPHQPDPLSPEEIVRLCKQHTMWSWSAGDSVEPPVITGADGVWITTAQGQRLLDWNSQLMSVNIGHGHPKVRAAMKAQIDELLYVYTGFATEVRARLGQKLASLSPGDIESFFFTLGGAEANENAVRMARLYTGRQKILARYRSYHGATQLTVSLTGDPRRWPNEPAAPGIVHVLDPNPYDFRFGSTPEEVTQNHLAYLEETIAMEGPGTIAAMIIETVTGTNGILVPPPGWLKGLRELLDRHGILLICDEVMCGLGRTGTWYAFEHGDIVPDIVTNAKGLTSSYAPLGAVGVSSAIANHFKKNVYWGGLTYNSHCLGLATALAVIEVMEEERMLDNVAARGQQLRGWMDRMQAKHPSVKEGRCIGLFGMVDLQKDTRGTPLAPFNGSHPAMAELAAFFRREGLFTFTRFGSFMCNPPLCITQAEMELGFEIIDRGLELVDRHVAD